MKLASVFKISAAAATIAGAGYGGYIAADNGYQRLANMPMPAIAAAERDTAKQYSLRFTTLLTQQQEHDNTTDEEEAGVALTQAKRSFATDAVLDRNLSEADLAKLAHDFNAISEEEGAGFRAYNHNAATIARRNECLGITPATAAPHGADRFAYAQRVETCMINLTDTSGATNAIAARMGGVAGGGMAFTFLLGFAARRRVAGNKGPKAR